MKTLILLLAAMPLLAAGPVAYRVDPPPVMTTSGTVPPTGFPALYAVAGANVYLYTDATLATLATTYMDTTGTNACPTFAQITEPGTACTSTSTTTGNFGWWLLPGNYFYKVTYGGKSYGPFPITTSTPGTGTLTGTGTIGDLAMWSAPTVLTNANVLAVTQLFCTGKDSTFYLAANGTCPQILPPTYTAPGGGVSILVNTDLINLSQSVIMYGAYCDGVVDPTTAAVTGHDDTAALQTALNALGSAGVRELTLPAPGLPSGPIGTGVSTGICLFSSPLNIGNGTSSSVSTVNGFRILGAGGYQRYNLTGNTDSYVLPTTGSSILLYNGSSLGTSAALTIQGPINDLILEGFAVDVHRLSTTAILFTEIAGSHIRDVWAINNLSMNIASDPYDAAFEIHAYNSRVGDFATVGTQHNVFDFFGSISGAATPAGILIGCPDYTSCPGSGFDAITNDVSINTFTDAKTVNYDSINSVGMVMGYNDSNNFYNPNLISQTGWFIIPTTLPNFPGSDAVIGGFAESSTSNLGLVTLGNNISGTDTTFTLNTGRNIAPPAPSVLECDQEVMWISAVTGATSPFNITVNKRAAGSGPPMAHTTAAGCSINGFWIDQRAAFNPDGLTPIQVLEFTPVQTGFGYAVGSDISTQMNALVQGINGITATGQSFNSSGSMSQNPFVESLAAFSNTLTATTSLQYFTLPVPWTIPYSQVGYFSGGPSQAVALRVRGKMAYTNTSGSSINIAPSVSITDLFGTLDIDDARSYVIPDGVTNGSINFDILIKIEYGSTLAAPTYLASGYWIYDDQTSSASVTHGFPPGGNSRGSNALLNGMTLKMGALFSATTGAATVQMTDLNIWLENPSTNGIQY